jgi:hypothetical protein
MSFKTPTQGLPPGLKVGDRASFSFSRSTDGYRIDSITALDETHAEQGP